MENKELVAKALEARSAAYTPYSGFRVGAALLCADGTVYGGCNIENAAYGPSNCAERTAFFKAVSEGEREFSAIAVVGGKDGDAADIFPPCGVCRQVIAEFKIPLIIAGRSEKDYRTFTLEGILPYAFEEDSLKKEQENP